MGDTIFAVRNNGQVDLSQFPTWAQIKQFQESPLGLRRLAGRAIHNHHTVPKREAEFLLRRVPQYANISEAEMTTLLDSMPGMLMNQFEHTGAGAGSFHNKLNPLWEAINRGSTTPSSGQVLDILEQAYTDWDPVRGPKIWEVARQWLTEKGVP